MIAFRVFLFAALGVATAAVLTVVWWAPVKSESLDPSTNGPDSGYAYTAPVRLDAVFPFLIETDQEGSPRTSILKLTEDSRLLGPAHAPHAEIRAKGEGRYSHWAGSLWFSSSDGSDPRFNGRTYHLEARTTLSPLVAYAVCAADLAFLLFWLRPLTAAVRRCPRLFFGVAVMSSTGIAAAVAVGAFGVIGSDAAPPKDTALVVEIVRHALIGCLLMLTQWAVGAGLARLILGRNASYARLALIGFPLSLAAVAAFAALALTLPYGRIFAGTLAAAALAPLAAWRVDRAALESLKRALPGFCVLSASFGCWMALHWHGPTATLNGMPSSNLAFYASSVWALAAHPVGWPNLGNEGEIYDYDNTLIPAFGAALLPILKLDGFLFITASGGTMGLLAAALALHAYFTARPALHCCSWPAAILVLAFLAAGRYPYWLVESPPVIAVAPLCVAVWFLVVEGGGRPSASLAAFPVAMVGSALSKVVTAATLGPLALAGLIPHLWRLPGWARIIGVTVVMASLAYSGLMIGRFLPFYLHTAPVQPESYELMVGSGASFSTAWPFVARDIATPLLMLLAFRLASWPVALAISFGSLLALSFPFLMRANLMCAVMIIGLLGIEHPCRLARARWHALATLLLMGAPMILRDPTGSATGVVWVAIAGGLWSLALVEASGEEGHPAARALRLMSGPAAGLVAALLLIGAARGTLLFSPEGWQGPAELTPQVRDIWAAVRERTPPDALIFTDQTGREPNLLGGWNTYALHGQRQVFIANYYMSLTLLNDPTARDARLALNEDVLSGRRAPSSVAVRGSYGSYFAVVSARRHMPDSWQRVYTNPAWVLYAWR